MAGTTEPFPQMTNDSCAELCERNISDCAAVEYYYSTGLCVVHRNVDDLQYLASHVDADVYVVNRCNTTGISVVSALYDTHVADV